MKLRFKKILLAVAILIILYGIGPKPEKSSYDFVELPTLPIDFQEIENLLSGREKELSLKLESKAQIIWANDSVKQKTPYSLVYLHGFSATSFEGNPTHRALAKKLGANMFLARLSDHGITGEDELLNFSAEQIWKDAKEALAIGQAIGNEVIVVGTSTGGTLGLMLAANFEFKALVNLSPNIEINDPTAFLLNNPWGLQIARIVLNGRHRSYEASDSAKMFWHTRYRIESLVQLQQLLEDNMSENTFKQIKIPVYVGCYYKNEKEQDQVVKISAMRTMFNALGTADNQKKFVEFPEAGDHVIASTIKSKSVVEVQESISEFLENEAEIKLPNPSK